MAGAAPTILALVEVNKARCPHRLDFLLGVARTLHMSDVSHWGQDGGIYGEVALARLECYQRLDRHVGGVVLGKRRSWCWW
jgi:hypothetical protein